MPLTMPGDPSHNTFWGRPGRLRILEQDRSNPPA